MIDEEVRFKKSNEQQFWVRIQNLSGVSDSQFSARTTKSRSVFNATIANNVIDLWIYTIVPYDIDNLVKHDIVSLLSPTIPTGTVFFLRQFFSLNVVIEESDNYIIEWYSWCWLLVNFELATRTRVRIHRSWKFD